MFCVWRLCCRAAPDRRLELASRWAEFLSVFVPLAARAASAAASGSLRRDEAVQRQLAKRFVAALEGLGPAFVKVRAW